MSAIVEDLARRFHAVYQEESKRQAAIGQDTVRHPDDYDALPERTKEYDRALARYVLAHFSQRAEETARTDERILGNPI